MQVFQTRSPETRSPEPRLGDGKVWSPAQVLTSRCGDGGRDGIPVQLLGQAPTLLPGDRPGLSPASSLS